MTNTFVLQPALQPGHVLAVRTGGWAADLIHLGERLHGLPDLDNHVAVMHHYDVHGVPRGLEGRPGGIGWVDLNRYLGHPGTVMNTSQDLSSDGELIAQEAEALVGTDYDWRAIFGDAVTDLGLPDLADLWEAPWHGGAPPEEMVCSSYAAWLYAKYKKPHPCTGRERGCQPGDWTAFIDAQGWLAGAGGGA